MFNLFKGFCVTVSIFSIIGIIYMMYIKLPKDFNNVVNYTSNLCHVKNQNITRILHQSWKNEAIPARFIEYSKSWKETYFHHWKYMFWTDKDNLNLIKTYYPWFLTTYNALPSAINRADVSRYFYMFHYGGIYTDLDNECLKPFEHLLYNYSLVFGAMKGQFGNTNLKEGYVQNSFMYSQPFHPIWLEIIISILNNKINLAPEAQTGPILLSNILSKYRERGLDHDMKIYPPNYFNPFSWLYKDDSSKNCKDFNQMSEKDWQICKKFFKEKGSYMVQYHAHTWG